MQQIMEQAKAFQKQHQDGLAQMKIPFSAGGGAVNVVINGNKEVTSLEISQDAMGDAEMLADTILAALNGAYSEADRRVGERTPNLDNLDLSSIMNMFKQ
ncbi:MAG: YbaB/EbfC family nucleoid-associated protein [Acidobacteriota bacterium]|nr:YbaB/EbfC family nucleoid-associated protein [Acidobacteriota bacterium]